MKNEKARNPNATGTNGVPDEGKGLPPAQGKEAWTLPTFTVLSGEGTHWNPHTQVVVDDRTGS